MDKTAFTQAMIDNTRAMIQRLLFSKSFKANAILTIAMAIGIITNSHNLEKIGNKMIEVIDKINTATRCLHFYFDVFVFVLSP